MVKLKQVKFFWLVLGLLLAACSGTGSAAEAPATAVPAEQAAAPAGMPGPEATGTAGPVRMPATQAPPVNSATTAPTATQTGVPATATQLPTAVAQIPTATQAPAVMPEEPMAEATLPSTVEVAPAVSSGPTEQQLQLLASLPSQGPAPELFNEVWLNSGPLKLADLRGKVVLIEFWTFG